MENDKTRILLVEDHASFRQALAFMFEREDEFVVVGEAGSLAEAREFLTVPGPRTLRSSTWPSPTGKVSISSRSFPPRAPI